MGREFKGTNGHKIVSNIEKFIIHTIKKMDKKIKEHAHNIHVTYKQKKNAKDSIPQRSRAPQRVSTRVFFREFFILEFNEWTLQNKCQLMTCKKD